MRAPLPFPAPPIMCTGSESPWVGQVHGPTTILGRQGGQGASCSMRQIAGRRGRDHLFGCTRFLTVIWRGANGADRRSTVARQGHRAVNPRAPVPPLLQVSEHGQAPRSSRTADVERGNGQIGSVGDRWHEAGQTTSPSNERSTVPSGEAVGSRTLAWAVHGSAIFLRLTGRASVVSASPPRMRAV
jgi:hypothetical protein